ncbi:MAG: GNAT family N-acetyltransferase [Actinomycetales bacterium]
MSADASAAPTPADAADGGALAGPEADHADSPPPASARPDPDDLPADYPHQWAADVVLRDGGTCHVRPIIPSDRHALQTFHMGQSERSRYLRFFAPLPRLSERDLDRFTQLDYVRRVALVAIIGERIVGVGRYDVIDPGEAEVAFNIADSEQGRGLGSVLLEHLAAAALERGVRRFVAEVLPENHKMVGVFADAGYEVTHHYDDGVISLEFGIEPTTESMAVVASRERSAEANSLRTLLQARSVAVIGASDQPESLGRVVVANIIDGGFTGRLDVVHPSASTVCGVPVVRRVGDIAEAPDVAVITVSRTTLPEIVQECVEVGVRGLVIITDGFRGHLGAHLEHQLVSTARAAGARVLGPASLGLVNTSPQVRLNASLLPLTVNTGGLSLFSQSAGLGLVLLSEAVGRGLGVSSFVSAGDRADISGNDLLQFWAEDDQTTVIALYTESSGNPRKFFRIARAVAASKPIVMIRSWTTGIASHSTTGRISRVPRAAFTAMLDQAGVIRAENVHDQVRIVHALMTQPLPTGDRVALVTNSQVLESLTVEAAESSGLRLVSRVLLPDPVDPDDVRQAIRKASERDHADAIVLALVPTLWGFHSGVLSALRETALEVGLTTMACLVAHDYVTTDKADLGPIPVYTTPEDAIRTLASVTRYAAWRHREHGSPVEPDDCQPERARELVERALADAGLQEVAITPEVALDDDHSVLLSPDLTQELLGCYGIAIPQSKRVLTPAAVAAAAAEIGYPVALKYADQVLRERPDITGAVLGIDDEDELLDELEMMLALTEPAVADGFIVQKMVPSGVPVDLRTAEDPLFGPIVSFGFSGDASELLEDIAYRIPPLTSGDVRDIIREVKASPKLFGHGGTDVLDVPALEDLVARVATLAEDLPEVAQFELRPILVTRRGVFPLWARVRLAPPPFRVDTGQVRRL